MINQTSEQAFESAVESMLMEGGWHSEDSEGWDVDLALFPTTVLSCISGTQPDTWDELTSLHGTKLENLILEGLAKELDIKGTLYVLRHGFRFSGRTIRIAWFKPAHGLNPDTLARYERNRLTVSRQVLCHPGKNDSVDVLFSLNGLPVATCELKNPMTGQNWKNAVKQYKRTRDPNSPLFRFKRRALVHFAADTDEIHMATKLVGEGTRFLPFNRGSHPGAVYCGAGNPQNPSGYRTDYFWRGVLERESFLDILGSYMFIEQRDVKIADDSGSRLVTRESVIFPRYHQLDSVRRLVTTAGKEGSGHNYLIQHSAGSGKTNSISWLSHRLASLHDTNDDKVFDCVVVITDRLVLDRQLRDAIYQIEHVQGVVKAIDRDSRQLAQALVDGTRIVITTIQKFPFVMKGLLREAGADPPDAPTDLEVGQVKEWRQRIAERRYAVIVDEAHSSQSGDSAREMKEILGSRAQEATSDSQDTEDWEDGLNAVVESRGPQPNLSFFAFTATPKGKTIELFGRIGASGKPESFHVYSMRQAIEENFILDVLQHYIDYDTWFRLVKEAEDDPSLPKRRTASALAKFMILHPHNIAQKTEVIIEHFRNNVRYHIGGRAKAMVVTSSRLQAVRYMRAFESYIAEHNYSDIRPLVAFSGTVEDPDTGQEFTEPRMNLDVVTGKPIAETALPGRFDSPDYHILLVAEKYQTGFDQPLLQAMYVDKRLDGVQAVQTLSRLNRVAEGKELPFVLDFVNDPEVIRNAFAPYYDRTELLSQSDPYQLEALKYELDSAQVYYHVEVDAFAKIFYSTHTQPGAKVHAMLEAELQPAFDRFCELEEDAQTEFRDKLAAFVRLYAFLSQIIPYGDSALERLSSYGRALLPHLNLLRTREPIFIGEDVELEYYRLQRMSSGAIILKEEEAAYVTSPSEVGTGNPEEEKAPLSEIIENLNDRFGTNLTDEDRLFFDQIRERAIRDEDIRRTAAANSLDKFSLGIREQIANLMIERMSENDAIVTQYMNDPDFQSVVFSVLSQSIYEAVHSADQSEEAIAPTVATV